jgi:hypothetical protein
MQEKDKNHTELDDFWDLSSLVPKLKKDKPQRAERPSVDGIEITVAKAAEQGNAQFADVPLTERPVSFAPLVALPEPLFSYIPTGALIRHVRVYPWKSKYEYYEQFRLHAERLAAREGKECPYADFFSYMPQYVQMNRAQLAYYLWWRTCFRRGTCLPAAQSYLLLYVFELINLGEKHQDPKAGQENLLRLWLGYRERYPMLDTRMCEWLCDYSLLHALPPPALPADSYRALLTNCRLKEFFVPAEENGSALHAAILLFCNNYDYRKSKFYRPDTKSDYDRVLRGAIRVTLDFLRERSGAALTDAEGISTLTRDAFSGAICSYRMKRRIEVDYTSFSHTHALRHVMTDVLKYAENALRAALGVKSRLSVYAVETALRERLDDYLKAALPARRPRAAEKKAPDIPEYERRYDLPAGEISAARAAEIEARSWQTTRRLVEAFDGAEAQITPQTDAESEENTLPAAPTAEDTPRTEVPLSPPLDAPSASPLAQALGDLADFLPLALAKDGAAQRDLARRLHLMPDAVADRINTVAGDMLGDILLEEENGVYTVIPDYIELLKEEGVL